jgi:hypothetical protein
MIRTPQFQNILEQQCACRVSCGRALQADAAQNVSPLQCYERTKQFWDQRYRADLLVKQGEVTRRGPVGKVGSFQRWLACTDQIEAEGAAHPSSTPTTSRANRSGSYPLHCY